MIKDKKGISVISIVITIVVLLMIASITAFSGMASVKKTREKEAKDRLNVIYNAIIAHEEELGFGDTVLEKQITDSEFVIMGLSDYADEENYTPVYVSKEIHDTDATKRIYNLKTLKKKNSEECYKLDPIEYSITLDNSNSKIEFDVKKGVNRPQVIGNMIALDTYLDEDEDIRTKVVQNVYTEDWYDYSFTTPKWANMELDNKQYVWIPRFAYKIQDFYLNKDYETIPSSAISIIFLKEDTNYMGNGEILPEGYEVHPAFSNGVEEYAGIWVAKHTEEDVDTLREAVKKCTEMHTTSSGLVESHLMKNTEWAAMAYLSFACGGDSSTGNSIGNSYGISDLNEPNFVAAALESANKFGYDEKFDIYKYDGEALTYASNEENHNGDAMLATSAQNSENSAWYKGKSILPKTDKPYILRRGDISFFAYEAITNERNHTTYRNVLTIK